MAMGNNIVTGSVKLLVKLHGQGSRLIDLLTDSFTIGRKGENDLSIDDPTVSSRHAKIVRVQSVYFLEDLNSTNGTAVNGKPVDRAQLHDADVITIGKHRIIFQDHAQCASVSATPSSDVEVDQTMAISGKEFPVPTMAGKVVVTAGKTDRFEYHLTKPSSLIGSQKGAAIHLTGWFAPKAAALISRRGNGFTISPSEGSKRLLVNGTAVGAPRPLKDGDAIEVAGVSMTFYIVQPKSK